MSSKFAILFFVTSALAIPYGAHPPYPVGNSTVFLPTGTGVEPTTTLQSTVINTETTVITNYLTLTRPSAGAVIPGESSVAPAQASRIDSIHEADAGAISGAAICGNTVTSTVSERITVYVTAATGVSSSVPSAAPPTQDTPHVVNAFESIPVSAPSSSVLEAPVFTEVPVSSPVSSPSTSVVNSESYDLPSGVEESISYPTSSSLKSGKRGLAYNDASLTSCFEGKEKITWAYNWGQQSDGLSGEFQYIPMLWGTRSDFTSNWMKVAKDAISGGTTHVMGFNEPDHADQANMSPSAAADAWKTFLEPLKAFGDVKLGAPGVTNGGDDMGLTWLRNFLTACTNCSIDFCPVHWYDSAENMSYFKKHLTEAKEVCGDRPIWLTEFGATGSDEQVNAFLKEAMEWMDGQDFIERYSYFMVKSGSGMLLSGTSESQIGVTYASA